MSELRYKATRQALGPQGEQVDALIERCQNLTPEESERLATAGAWDEARDAAWCAAGAAARNAAKAAAWNAAWAAAWNAAWAAARNVAWAAARDAARDAAGDAAWCAAGDAAGALAVKDLISQEHFDTLYGPWEKVIK